MTASAAGGPSFGAIVIGAGFAGIAAACELDRLGHRTLVLEARDRLGGRTWTSPAAGAALGLSGPLEMGGMTVHWTQPHVWAEITRSGAALVEPSPVGEHRFVAAGADTTVTATEAAARGRRLYGALFDSYRSLLPRPYDPGYVPELLAESDRSRLRDRVISLDLPDPDRAWLLARTNVDGSLLSALRWYALSGWSYDGFAEVMGRYQLREHTAALLESMLAGTKVEVRQDSPVAEVRQADAVTVLTRSGQGYEAPVAVVAVPVNVWSAIRFAPELPPAHLTAAAEGFGVRCLTKVWARIRGTGPLSLEWSAESPVTSLRSIGEVDGDQLAVGFVRAPAEVTADGAAALLATELSAVLPRAQVLASVAHCWEADEYARGGHALLGPGQYAQLVPQLQRPFGRLGFATADIAPGWAGFIDGAIESGLAAARATSVAAGARV